MDRKRFHHICIAAFCLLSWLQAAPADCQMLYAESSPAGAGPHYYSFSGGYSGLTPRFNELSVRFADAFEVYLDRADMRKTREAWLETARFGLQAVTAEWERRALLMQPPGRENVCHDGADEGLGAGDGAGGESCSAADRGAGPFGAFRTEFTARLESRLSERFQSWLMEEFFRRSRADEAAELFEEVGEANLLHLFETGQEGSLQYDAAGDPILEKSAGFEGDLADWRRMVAGREDELLSAWEENARIDATELLPYLQDAGNAELEEQAAVRFAEYKAGLSRELAALFAAEERRFVNKRLRDQYSLRKKQEGESAGEVAAELISAAEENLEVGLEAVRTGLEKHGSGKTEEDAASERGEIAIDPENWRASFRREFEKGLEEWNRAEESLLETRTRWEHEISTGFLRNEEAWAAAYREITAARREWENELYAVLEEGRMRWEEKQVGLAGAINDAGRELSRSIEERVGALEAQLGNLAEVILQSREMMRTARASAEYWEDRSSKEGGGDGTAQQELQYWESVYSEYAGYAENAAAEFADAFGTAFFGRESDASGTDEPGGRDATAGMFRAAGDGSYQDVLTGDGWKHVFLDDYQAELLKAEALKKYWKKELEISRGVYEYAVDETSGRKTEAETRQEYSEALRLYREKKEGYEQAAAELNGKGEKLSVYRTELEDLRNKLSDAEAELDKARSAYTVAMDLVTTGNDEYFRSRITEYENRLRELRGRDDTAIGLPAALEEYYAAAEEYESERHGAVLAREKAALVNGNPENEMLPSLEELEMRRLAAEKWSFPDDAGDLRDKLKTCLGLEQGSGLWIRITEEYKQFQDAAASGRNGEAWFRKRVIAGLAENVCMNIEADCRERKEALGFLGASDAEEWLRNAGINPHTAETEAEHAAFEYFRRKAETEQQALLLILDILGPEKGNGGTGAGAEAAGGPGSFCPGLTELDYLRRAAEAGDVPSALAYAYFLAHTGRMKDSDMVPLDRKQIGDRAAELESIAAGSRGPFLMNFLQGEGSFRIEGTDLASLFLTEAAAERRAAEYRYEMLTRYRSVTPFSVSAMRRDAYAQCAEYAASAGGAVRDRSWGSGDSGRAEFEEDMVSAACGCAAAARLSAAGRYAVMRYIDGLYGWVSLREAAGRCSRIGAQAAVEEARAGLEAAEEETAALVARLERVRDCCGGSSGASPALTFLDRVHRLCVSGAGEGRFLSPLGRQYGEILAGMSGLLELYRNPPEDTPKDSRDLDAVLRKEAEEAWELQERFPGGIVHMWEDPEFPERLTAGSEFLLAAAGTERMLLLAGVLELAERVLEAELEAGEEMLEKHHRKTALRSGILDAAKLIGKYGQKGKWYAEELSLRRQTWEEALVRIEEEAADDGSEEAAPSGGDRPAGEPCTDEELQFLFRAVRDGRAEIEEIEGEINGVIRLYADTLRTLELFAKEKGDRYTRIVRPLELKAEEAEERYLGVQADWDKAAKKFAAGNREYEEAYEQMNRAAAEKEEAQHRFRKADAVSAYASHAYLQPEAALQRFQETEKMYEKVARAYDALYSVYVSSDPKRFSEHAKNENYRTAFKIYRDRFRNALALKQIHGLINQAVAEQEVRVADAEMFLAEKIGAVFSCNSGTDREEMLELFLGKEGSREKETAVERWCSSAYDLLRSKGKGMLRNWGLAYWHLKWKDADKNSDLFLSHLQELVGNPKQFFDEEGIDYLSSLTETSKAAWGSLAVKEKELLAQYVHWMDPGKGSRIRAEMKLFLEEQMKAEINRRLGEICERKRQENEKAADGAYITAGSFYALGTAFSWFPPVCVPAFASAALFMGLGFDFEHTAGKFEEAGKETEKTVRTVVEERLEPSVQKFSQALSAYHRASKKLKAEQETLALLTGPKAAGKLLAPDDFADAVIKAGNIRGKDVGSFLGCAGAPQEKVRAALISMISAAGYFDALTQEERRGCGAVCEALADRAEDGKNAAAEDFEAAASENRQKQCEAVQEYRKATAAVLEDDGSRERDADSCSVYIEDAFGVPSYRQNEHLADVYHLYGELMGRLDSIAFPFAASIEEEVLRKQAEVLCRIYAERMMTTASVLEHRWAVRMDDLVLQERRWEEQMKTVLAEGSRRWAESIAQIDRTRQEWIQQYEAEYAKQVDMWNLKYLALTEKRNRWVEEAGRKAAYAGSEAVLRELGEEAETAVRQAGSIVLPKLERPAVSPGRMAEKVLTGRSFGSMLSYARSGNRRISFLDTGLYAGMVLPGFSGLSPLPAGGPGSGYDVQIRCRKEIEEHIALITAGRAREAVKCAIDRFREAVDEANFEVEEDIHLMLTGKKFVSASGNRYTRTVLVDDTVLGGKEHETQLIRGYEEYTLPDIVLGVDLSESTLSALGPAGVEAQIELAFNELDKLRRRIFGITGDGDFGDHVGETASLKERPDPKVHIEKNLSDRGSGELGRISRVFFGFLLKENRGWTEFNKPLSEKRLWDDDGSFLKAPTIRGIADIGTAVLVNAVAPGAGFALNLIDDAVFSVADVAKGRYSAGDALLRLGKKGIAAGATAGIGAGAGALKDMLGGGFFGNTVAAGVKSFGGTVAGGAVHAVELDGQTGRLRFNGRAFFDAVAGKEAVAGYAGGIASAAISGALAGNLEGLEGTYLEGDIRSVAGLAGAAADAGIEYGLTGQTTLNVLNAAGTGVLELSLGKHKKSLAFGTGGTDMNFARLLRAARGLGAWGKQQRIRIFERFGEIDFHAGYTGYRKAGTLLRSAWAYGDAVADRAVEALLAGADRLHVGFGTGAGRGRTAAGTDGSRDIYLSSLGTSADRASRLRAGVVLQHEAWRDGVVSGSDLQKLETVAAVAAHTEMALAMTKRYGSGTILGDGNLVDDVQAYLHGGVQFVNYVSSAYSSEQDFWKLLQDGNLQYDGTGFLRDAKGELVRGEDGKAIGARGIEGGLLKILGLEDTPSNRETVIAMMVEAGLEHTVGPDPEDTTAWMWNLGSNDGRTVEIGRKAFLHNYLHHLDARDHYTVLGEKALLERRLIGIAGTEGIYRDPTFEEWCFENAVNTYRNEMASMKEDLMRDNGWSEGEARDFLADVTGSFASLDQTSGPEEFLEELRTGLRTLLESSNAEGRHHTLVHFTDRVFRGTGGDMGLAEALRAAYQAAGYDEEYALGLSVQAAAETYTDEYLHMIYGLRSEEERKPKSQYLHNYSWGGGNFDYASKATGYFDPENGYRWTGSDSENPAADCVGFANLAYHSAGLIGYNEQLNLGGGSVDSIFRNENVSPVDNPLPGDLIFMNGHVGIYGVDEGGTPILIHSAPAVEVILREKGEKDTYAYTSGPRINEIGDAYWKKIIEERDLMKDWKEKYRRNYGRWIY